MLIYNYSVILSSNEPAHAADMSLYFDARKYLRGLTVMVLCSSYFL